jgi:hypothetical protein
MKKHKTKMISKERKLIGQIGVDSGTIWVGDPCYLLQGKRPKSLGKDWDELVDKTFDNGKCLLPTSFNYDMGHEGLGVMSKTKYGDGSYPVYMVGDNDGIYIDFR